MARESGMVSSFPATHPSYEGFWDPEAYPVEATKTTKQKKANNQPTKKQTNKQTKTPTTTKKKTQNQKSRNH